MSASNSPCVFRSERGHCVIELHQSMSEASWAEIEQLGATIVGQLSETRRPNCLVDLTHLEYMGSAMVAFVVRLWKAIREHGGQMVVVSGNEFVLQVLSLAGLDKVWTIVPSESAALQKLGVNRSILPTSGGRADEAGAPRSNVAFGFLAAGGIAVVVAVGIAAVVQYSDQISAPLTGAFCVALAVGIVCGVLGLATGRGAARWQGGVLALVGCGLFAGAYLYRPAVFAEFAGAPAANAVEDPESAPGPSPAVPE